jgi:niacin transporter
MNVKNNVLTMTIAGLLCAIGIIIPMFAPKILIPPASYTLASHVAIFIAMFISPYVAIPVALITTLGFFIGGFPLIVVLRALSHIIFVVIGSFILKHNKRQLSTTTGTVLFGLLMAIIHAISEVAVVTFFYWGNNITEAYYQKGYLFSVVLLVGIGTIIHSMIDYGISILVWEPLQKVISIPVSVRRVRKQA